VFGLLYGLFGLLTWITHRRAKRQKDTEHPA
jgi:hypothetical protein